MLVLGASSVKVKCISDVCTCWILVSVCMCVCARARACVCVCVILGDGNIKSSTTSL